MDGGTDCSHHISKIKLNEIKLGLLQSIYVQVWHLAIFCASPRLSQQQALTTSLAPGMQADSVQNCPLNTQESVNKPATIPQTSSSHVPTIALSPLSQSESLICITNFSKSSFSFSAPTLWNELPAAIRKSNTLDTFKRRLKTHLTSLTTRNV